MALRAPRRPLQQTAQNNLASTQAAHRQRLQAAAAKPPQLPIDFSSSDSSLSRLRLSQSPEQEAGASSSRSAQSPRGVSSRVHSSIIEARSFSAEAFTPPSSSPSGVGAGVATDSLVEATSAGTVNERRRRSRPQSDSSSRNSPRTASAPSSREGRRAEPTVDFELPRWSPRSEFDNEEDFDAELEELEDLCRALNMRSEERLVPMDVEPRPLTGGTSASASTTAPGGSSKDFEVDYFEEHASEATRDSENPFDTLRGGQRASYDLQQCGALPHGCRIERTAGASAQFFFSVDAAEGPYAPTTLVFWIKIFDEFPALDGISIRSTKRIFHPSVDQDSGQLKLQLGGAGSASEHRFHDVLAAIRRLVLSPADSPAVNADAAMLLQTDPDEFRRVVRSTLGGGEYRGVRFDRVLDFSKKRACTPDSSAEQQRPQISDQMKVELMQLDVLQAKFKALADNMIKENTLEYRDLEASSDV